MRLFEPSLQTVFMVQAQTVSTESWPSSPQRRFEVARETGFQAARTRFLTLAVTAVTGFTNPVPGHAASTRAQPGSFLP